MLKRMPKRVPSSVLLMHGQAAAIFCRGYRLQLDPENCAQNILSDLEPMLPTLRERAASHTRPQQRASDNGCTVQLPGGTMWDMGWTLKMG